jgi:hypothetical protein
MHDLQYTMDHWYARNHHVPYLFLHDSAPAISFTKSTTKQSLQSERWKERKQNVAHSKTIKKKSNVCLLLYGFAPLMHNLI